MEFSLDPFAKAVNQLEQTALQEFDRQIATCFLHYHNRDHIIAVKRRSQQIFQVIRPYLPSSENLDRLSLLLDLCAVTHDLIQIFIPQTDLHHSRRREAGVSETATITVLFELINHLQSQDTELAGLESAPFSDIDYQILQTAISATICEYDPQEQAIFQPILYQPDFPSHSSIGWVARTLAMADIGSLGIEGIESYNTEGSLIFLEENPDVQTLIAQRQIQDLPQTQPELAENIRQRLLKRARFQVNFAKSRLKRCSQELAGFPAPAISMLSEQVFQYLTPATIQSIELITPTAESASLESLLSFFQFDRLVHPPLINRVITRSKSLA